MWLLEDEYKSNPTEDTLRLLDIAKDFLQIYQMTLDSLDEVENNEKTVRIS
ncbi:hypothetical protein WS105_0640 [Weissella ceti]|uniref:hypothetical protein n=1 Tax=Weissella ceti TaxID=759620 RepID=UPI0004F74D40|nr:hypothetical protein [Weissella ceti]AIM64230.1 hypothetical protein WS105_0640 [Weissella ceti]